MRNLIFTIIILQIFLLSCTSIRESAGVNRKLIDEYTVIENPPLIIPPDYNLISPEQMQSKKIDDTEKDLAKEILFGLSDEEDQNTSDSSLISTIVDEVESGESDVNIRETINKEFAGEKSSINDETKFQSEDELNQAISETKNKGSSINDSIQKEKKKKRFFFFNSKVENKDENEDEPKKKKRFFFF